MKKCNKCKLKKEYSLFYKDKKTKDGYYSTCKSCKNIATKQFREKNPDYMRTYMKNWEKNNKEKRTEINNRSMNKNRDKIIIRCREYNRKNKDKISLHKKEYYQNNKDKIKTKTNNYYHKNKAILVPKNTKRTTARRRIDPLFNLICRLRRRLAHALKMKKWNKGSHFNDYIGCKREELFNHIEKQFIEGMNWENRHLWHIDHIIPLSSANSEKELYKLSHYTNLQPLWAKDNLKKHTTILQNPNARALLQGEQTDERISR